MQALHRILVAAFACAAFAAQAQGVFRCSEGGKTTYQSTPCAAQGREVTIAPPPSEQDVQAAKARADADKARGAQADAAQRHQQEPRAGLAAQPVGRKYDCEKLNKQRGDAFGRRNATVRDSRDSNIDKSASIQRDHDEIRFIESQMLKGGCNPT